MNEEEKITIPKYIDDMEVINVTYASLDRPGVYRTKDFTLSELNDAEKKLDE